MKSGLGISPALALLLSILAPISPNMRYKHTVSIRNMGQYQHVSSGGFGSPALLR